MAATLKRLKSVTSAIAGAMVTLCWGLLVIIFLPLSGVTADHKSSLSDQERPSADRQVVMNITTDIEQPAKISVIRRADFRGEYRSNVAQQIADWVVHFGDNLGMPFVIIDKTDARVFVFHADGRLHGAAPVLLGLAVGDDVVPGIGNKKLSEILPNERTTPAGRFLARLGPNFNKKEVLWVDYENSVSLHRVVTNNPVERRIQRLATPTPTDNRISYGCINVPVEFFDAVVSPTFRDKNGMVYVLPETRSIGEIFKQYYDVQ